MRLRALLLAAILVGFGYLAGRAFTGAGAVAPSAPHSSPSPGAAGSPPGRGTTAPPSPTVPAALQGQSPPVPDDLSPEEKRNIGIFRRAASSVVHIENIATRREFFSFVVMQVQQGSGRGFVRGLDGKHVPNSTV